MRKYEVRMLKFHEKVLAINQEEAKGIAKDRLGISRDTVVCSMINEYFNGIDNIIERINSYIEITKKPPVIDTLTPCYLFPTDPKCPSEIEILKPSGYFDKIYFEIGEEKMRDKVYDLLKFMYNL